MSNRTSDGEEVVGGSHLFMYYCEIPLGGTVYLLTAYYAVYPPGQIRVPLDSSLLVTSLLMD